MLDETQVFNSQQYVDQMGREDQYDWQNTDYSPSERLQTLVKFIRSTLTQERSENPNAENDLAKLNTIQDEADGIEARSWLVGLATALLGIAGNALFFSQGGQNPGILLHPMVMCIGMPVVGLVAGIAGKMFSEDFIFKPMANRFIQDKVNFNLPK
jgi:hypothetical protein